MSKEYIEQAVCTLSNQFHGDKVTMHALDEALRKAIYALKDLDAIKKTLFYGKELPPPLDYNMTYNANCNGVPDWFENRSLGEIMIHGIIGAATETGEMLELLFNTVVRGNKFDSVNLSEEVGDAFWYFAILAKFGSFSFEGVQAQNIAKLRKRYGEKFSAYDAINRDVDAERVVLEEHTFGKQWTEVSNIVKGKEEEELLKIRPLAEILSQTDDAQVWAKEFMKVVNAMPNICQLDEGFMIGWFANCIEMTSDLRGTAKQPHVSIYGGHKNLAEMIENHIPNWRDAMEWMKIDQHDTSYQERELKALAEIEAAVKHELNKA